MPGIVLITGASGLIGRPLCRQLQDGGYTVHALSRSENDERDGIKFFQWDPEKGIIDRNCIHDAVAVIHLAGEAITAKPWTKAQKQKIIKSRTESIKLVYKLIRNNSSSRVKTIISASGVGYYGHRGDELLTEQSRPGNDFLAQTCIAWENAVNEGETLGLRVVKLRTGVVLSSSGGALPQLAKPVKLGIGAALGSGKQWMPWIHIEDAVQMYMHVLKNEQCKGTYNMAAPSPVRNKELVTAVARRLKKPLWLPSVPVLFLQILLGEMKAVVLNSTNTSSEKISFSGFKYNFNSLDDALKDIYG